MLKTIALIILCSLTSICNGATIYLPQDGHPRAGVQYTCHTIGVDTICLEVPVRPSHCDGNVPKYCLALGNKYSKCDSITHNGKQELIDIQCSVDGKKWTYE